MWLSRSSILYRCVKIYESWVPLRKFDTLQDPSIKMFRKKSVKGDVHTEFQCSIRFLDDSEPLSLSFKVFMYAVLAVIKNVQSLKQLFWLPCLQKQKDVNHVGNHLNYTINTFLFVRNEYRYILHMQLCIHKHNACGDKQHYSWIDLIKDVVKSMGSLA